MGAGEMIGRELLSGPRGRRACLSLLASADPRLWSLARRAEAGSANPDFIVELADALTAPELLHYARGASESSLMAALTVSVDAARYWQQPDETDLLLDDPRIRTALIPAADAIASSSEAAWWSTPLEREKQRYVQWMDETPLEPPALVGAVANLARWRVGARADESRSLERPRKLTANSSGEWWSAPVRVPLPTTTRARSTIGAVKLALAEDGFGWEHARVWPLLPSSDCQVFEVTGPDAWAELVGRYPMDVSLSRRHDWWRATGHEGTWLIPDWAGVASDFDAVHLTVFGYLGTAGRALPVRDSHTVLAGWSPDETYWLADVLTQGGAPEDWCRDQRTSRPWTVCLGGD